MAVDPTTGKTYPQALIGSFAPGVGNPSDGMYIGGLNGAPTGLYSVPALAVAPRFGFAYAVNPRTVDSSLTDRLTEFRLGDVTGRGILEFALSRSRSYQYRPTLV